MVINFLTASFLSSNPSAIRPESLSMPSVNCVKSFEPIEKPSKYCKKSSAIIAFDGSSHIMIILKPSFPRSSPFSFKSSITFEASVVVRTKGIIISTFLKPISFLTFLIARHSSSKHSLKSEEIYRDAPRKPIIGFSSCGS